MTGAPGLREEPAAGAGVPRLRLAGWEERHGVVAGITLRGAPAAPFDLGLGGAQPVAAVLDRWGALQADLPGIRGVAVGRQVHGTRVAWQAAGPGLRILADTDGHATATPGLLLAVTAADCVPVFLLDPVRRVVGLLHAGWRGTAGGILARGLGVLGENGSRVSDVLIHLGPSICGDCYEVGSEVFEACGTPVPPAGRGGLDLRAVLADQARGCGAAGVSVSPFCTAHHADRFFSHRGSGGEPGRMAAYLGLGLPV